ncbi:MAG TPA: DUF4232 domain-containing protein [Actinomycetota bacterium]|jgi:Protein of unknown function (DUF4232)
MPTTRRLPAVLFLAALLLSACARGQAGDRNAAPAPATTSAPTATTQASGEPTGPPSTTSPPVDRPVIRRCSASALRGSGRYADGAAGTLWYTVQLRNVSARTCTVKGSPEVRLLDVQGLPLFVSGPARPDGSLVSLRPGAAAQFALGVSDVCDSTVGGPRIRVTLPQGQGSLVVKLGFATCRTLQVQPLAPSGAA